MMNHSFISQFTPSLYAAFFIISLNSSKSISPSPFSSISTRACSIASFETNALISSPYNKATTSWLSIFPLPSLSNILKAVRR